jgi:hypothetical protein
VMAWPHFDRLVPKRFGTTRVRIPFCSSILAGFDAEKRM